MQPGLGAASPKHQPVLVPIGSIPKHYDNPEVLDVQVSDFEKAKANRLNRIRRQIRDFNLESYKARRDKELQRERRERQAASLENRRMQENIQRQRQQQRTRRMSIQQSLLGEYKKQMTIKEQRKGKDLNYQQYYDQLQSEENQKQDDIRVRQLGKIFESEHTLRLPPDRIKTEGYETAARKELSRQLNSYITHQAKGRMERERLESERAVTEEAAIIQANLEALHEQQRLSRVRKQRQHEMLRRDLQKQITWKNERGAAFPPIVQYRSHRLSDLQVRYS